MIKQFKGKYRFLSNFYPSVIWHEDIMYPTVEHFYQAMKTTDRYVRTFIAMEETPGRAKRQGRVFRLRADWEEVKVSVMMHGLRIKFNDGRLGRKLIDTFPLELIEGNWWGDEVWGVSLKTGEGENKLGVCLMEVRKELVDERKQRWEYSRGACLEEKKILKG